MQEHDRPNTPPASGSNSGNYQTGHGKGKGKDKGKGDGKGDGGKGKGKGKPRECLSCKNLNKQAQESGKKPIDFLHDYTTCPVAAKMRKMREKTQAEILKDIENKKPINP